MNGPATQNLEISGAIGTFTHVVILGTDVILKKDLNLTQNSSTLRIEGGSLNFNQFNVIGLGNFRFNSGTIKITSSDGVNQSPLPAEADQSFLYKGNVQNLGVRYLDQGATFWYIGNESQMTGFSFGIGSSAKKIIIDNPATVKLSKSTGIGPQGRLDILLGTFEETNESLLTGTGIFNMLPNTVYRSSIVNDAFPKLNPGNLSAGSTLELFAVEGIQLLKNSEQYRNITFSGGGIKNITTAIATIYGTVTVKENATLDVENKTFGGETTNLTMTGGKFRTSKLNDAQPSMNGNYNLTAGTVEFYGTSSTTSQTLRGGKGYHNVNISSIEANTDANNVKFGAGIVQISGVFKILSPSVFQIGGGLGQFITGPGHFVVEEAATFLYGNAKGITTAACGETEVCGNIRTTSRTFPTNASYGFIGSSAGMTSGNGLPPSIKNLYIRRENHVVLSQNLSVENNILFSGTGKLFTNDKVITLSSKGRLIEIESAHIVGIIATTRDASLSSDFGGIGFEFLYFLNNPGQTTITRTTGIPIIANQGNESILRYFEVLPEVEDIDATIRFRYFNAELNGIPETELRLFQAELLEGPWHNKGGAVNDPQNFIMEENINDFDFITAASIMSPLPIVLIKFEGFIDKAGAHLSWQTASEKNNDYFTLEQSFDNIDFLEVAVIPAAGTSLFPTSYFYNDAEFDAESYFRLKQTDYDGEFTILKTIYLKPLQQPSSFSIFPNPVENIVHLSLNSFIPQKNILLISLHDSFGNEIIYSHEDIQSFNKLLNNKLPELKSGIYTIRITSTDNVYIQKFIKL